MKLSAYTIPFVDFIFLNSPGNFLNRLVDSLNRETVLSFFSTNTKSYSAGTTETEGTPIASPSKLTFALKTETDAKFIAITIKEQHMTRIFPSYALILINNFITQFDQIARLKLLIFNIRIK